MQGQEHTRSPLHFSFPAKRKERTGKSPMNKYTIAFASVTTAMKAQIVLRANEFYAAVARTPRNLASGCGYSVTFAGDVERALAVLEQHGIKYKAVMEIK